MIGNVLKKVFGSSNDRYIRKIRKTVDVINSFEESIKPLSDVQLKEKTKEFKERLKNGETLDQILPEAFAVVREASWRVLGERHYDVQLIGGIILHQGKIAEMKTGEGKTLTSTAPIYLNALTGKGVHVVTVNDYLAKRDAEWMSQVYSLLGLTCGCITNDLYDDERKEAYNADITYGTNNEFGFDYLRDNMKFSRDEMVQRPYNFAIVDEVDSILIDEARTPLIISGPAEDSSEMYGYADKYVRSLTVGDFELDEKTKNVTLTDQGAQKIETWLENDGWLKGASLYSPENISLVHHINQALRAQKAFHKDVDYIVKDNKVYIVDEFTGRVLEGRRYSDGLHQALEAKEKVKVQLENQTLASVTYQNYFRMYPKLSGMTGTAVTEATEFTEIYKLDVIEIPTHRDIQRIDYDDEVYRTRREKIQAIVKQIKICQKRKQPVLLGTASIESSEIYSRALKQAGVKHQVLNARQHEKEADIIANAGEPGAITIATNMAGRGTDIKLGGNFDAQYEAALSTHPNAGEDRKKALAQEIKDSIAEKQKQVVEAGGLFIVGTERHESRRIDNQLRGRSGRQGDPGASKFYLSLEDDLMRIFGSDRLDALLQRFGLKEGEAITHPWVNKALERAQKKVEARNYDVRKHLLKYDDIMNEQRKIIYSQRIDVMESDSIHNDVLEMQETLVERLVDTYLPADTYVDNWDLKGLHEEVLRLFALDLPISDWANVSGTTQEDMTHKILVDVKKSLRSKEKHYTSMLFHRIEKDVYLRVVDHCWKDHLHSLDHLREGINLRAYAQRDPLHEYKREAYELFQRMIQDVDEKVVSLLHHLEMHKDGQNNVFEDPVPTKELHGDEAADEGESFTFNRDGERLLTQEELEKFNAIPRNSPCPCGSGKKFKHCHGQM